jgi:hypothetical protein
MNQTALKQRVGGRWTDRDAAGRTGLFTPLIAGAKVATEFDAFAEERHGEPDPD